ncbi:sugar phosphate isomerase/epimerase family protein [Parapedobacter indicus]|uniref:Tat (Twin-arginine translocation) pathway signal sequence n=1 Tax=Parapedobacter indicus TaxID=1477437 RepID=A0A1I3M5F6_9SPHI|nr:sugar phosphate isomerase/epimerase [Parapedobacter indicus]PPL01275.1 secreted protein [Parapedobacter indicus]SFI92183.1 Tat (twin-arginine translocation) pathway signal sequence [Parapedobacter indicus]
MKNSQLSRRQFLGTAALAAAGIAVSNKSAFGMPAYIRNLNKPNSVFKGVQIGVITYSFRSMPSSAEQLLQYCRECGVGAVELMGDAAETFAGAPVAPARPKRGSTEGQEAWKAHLQALAAWREKVPMTRFEQLRKLYNDAGVKIYGYKPSALGVNNTDGEVEYAFRAAKALGANQANIEFPTDPAQTKRLGTLAAKHKVYVGYHGHTQQTFDMWDSAIAQSRYNAMNFDMGHYVAAGFDAIEFIKAKHQHIVSMHVKDRQTKEHGGANLPWGQGDTPIAEALNLMSKSHYKFPATIELEYQIPEGSNAVQEVAKCLEFARKALGA